LKEIESFFEVSGVVGAFSVMIKVDEFPFFSVVKRTSGITLTPMPHGRSSTPYGTGYGFRLVRPISNGAPFSSTIRPDFAGAFCIATNFRIGYRVSG
jgi:hypothetical protein